VRENVDARGRRLLTEARLRVLEASEDGGYVSATCRGSGAQWNVGFEDGRWRCDCPAAEFGRRCAHVVALQLVCVMEPRR
jgi:uncharacterized Zn finger protein